MTLPGVYGSLQGFSVSMNYEKSLSTIVDLLTNKMLVVWELHCGLSARGEELLPLHLVQEQDNLT